MLKAPLAESGVGVLEGELVAVGETDAHRCAAEAEHAHTAAADPEGDAGDRPPADAAGHLAPAERDCQPLGACCKCPGHGAEATALRPAVRALVEEAVEARRGGVAVARAVIAGRVARGGVALVRAVALIRRVAL